MTTPGQISFCILCSCDPLPTNSDQNGDNKRDPIDENTECNLQSSLYAMSISSNPPASSIRSPVQKEEDKVTPKNSELFEILCKYLGVHVPLPNPDVLDMNSEKVRTFCTQCVQHATEIFSLHQKLEQVKNAISKRIKEIEENIVKIELRPSKMHQDKKSFNFVEEFRQEIWKKVKSIQHVEEISEDENQKQRGQGPPYLHIVEIKPSLMHRNLNPRKIKIQPEDTDEDGSFSTEDAEIYPFFNDDTEADVNFKEPYEENDGSRKANSPPVVSNFRRKLRPRRAAGQPRHQNSLNHLQQDESQKIVKLEPESDVDEREETDFFDIDPDEIEDPASDDDDPDVNFSSESEEDNGSDPEDEDWGSAPKKRSRLSGSEPIERMIKNRVKRSKKMLDKDGNEVGKWDIVFSSDGRLFFESIEIVKTETKTGLILRCGECNREFNIPKGKKKSRESPYYKLKCHIRGYHLGTYNCKICSKPLSCTKSLSRHIQRHHTTRVKSDAPKAHCDICGKPFKTESKDFLFTHTWSHKSEEEKASEISRGTKPPLTYAEKVEAKKQKKQETFLCTHPQCGKTFLWKSLLKKHENRVHVPEDQKVKNFACHVCGKLFAAQGDLTAHKRYVCEKEKLARLFFCSFCEKTFTTKDDCATHERKHTKEKPFQCIKCLKLYSQDKSMKRHLRDCKGKEGSSAKFYQGVEIFHEETETGFIIKCGCCDFAVENIKAKQARCDTYRKIHLHIQGKHLGAFKCPICDKKLSDPKGLRNHLETHDNEAPKHRCEICGKPFKTNKNKKFLLSHLWSHMSEEEKQERITAGETPPITYAERMEMLKSKEDNLFQCDQCGKTFAWQCQLKKHERVHTGDTKERRTHQCAACGKFYATADGLNSHVKHVHDKDKVHKWHYCSFCEKKFSHKFAWRKHERSHRRDTLKAFQCQVCTKAFSQEKNFQNHIKQCHSSEEQEPIRRISKSSHSSTITSEGGDRHRGQSASTMPLPPGGIMPANNREIGSSNGLLMPQQQFRQIPPSPPSAASTAASGSTLPPGHHFMLPGQPGLHGSNRFYEDGNIFQNFF